MIIGIIWLVILTTAIFAYAMRASSDMVTLSVMPEVPRKGEPISVAFNLNNTGLSTLPVSYDFIVNGTIVKSGSAVLKPLSTAAYSFNYISEAELGTQTTFVVRAATSQGDYGKAVAVPAYAPQVWSSFVSFASFSTSVMGSMSSMVYYQDSFMQSQGMQVRLVFAVVLLALLVFRDVTVPVPRGVSGGNLVLLRVKFGVLAAVLLIIFLGMIFTRIVMILA